MQTNACGAVSTAQPLASTPTARIPAAKGPAAAAKGPAAAAKGPASAAKGPASAAKGPASAPSDTPESQSMLKLGVALIVTLSSILGLVAALLRTVTSEREFEALLGRQG